MSQEDDMVIVPIQGDQLRAVTVIYAIRDAVKDYGKQSRARSLAITKLEEAAMWMRVAAEEEGE